MKGLFSYLFYPLILAIAGLAYSIAFQLSHYHLLGVYAAVSVAASVIFIAEKTKPLHQEWVPTKSDLVPDVFFYALIVQVLFPFTLYFSGIYFLKMAGYQNGMIADLWPHQLPVLVQFLILTVAGEFFQYWWHRLCHTSPFLWPIHSVHHFPQKLYSWNTSKFHFLDKFVEFFFTVFIFMAFGLTLEVFSYYYVFYAITGYVQHSNLDIKMGLLDYVVASAETHRFHHDSNLNMSKCNYANNLVLFDLLFGTFKRSNEKIVRVGVRSKNVPVGLWEEIKTPFTHFHKRYFQFIVKISMNYVAAKKVERLRTSAKDPQATQSELLFKMLEKNKNTVFGREHDFFGIKTIQDFHARVPIRDYEEHRKYIELILNGTTNVLNTTAPHYFTKTSGTTGRPKYIPINKETQASFVNSQQILGHALFSKDPRFLEGDIFSIVGKDVEEKLNGIWPCGSMSGKLYSLAHKSVQEKHIFHHDILALNDSEKKYYYLAALAVLSPETSYYVSPNPTSLLKIFEILNSKKQELLELIESGIDPIIKKHAARFDHAKKLLNSSSYLTARDVWPNLRIASMWMQGSCSYLIPEVKKLLGNGPSLCELGFLASEFYGTLPLGPDTNQQIPTLLDHYFEFIEKNHYESGGRKTLELHELEINTEYYIIVTTQSFYRYFINDIIKVTGYIEKTPTVVFSQKGKGVTNITGEKISEKQLVSFFEKLNQQSLAIKFFICLADQSSQAYTMYVESEKSLDLAEMETMLDSHLKEVNIEYASKVSDQRIRPITILPLQKGTAEAYRADCLRRGQSESQFKFLHLQYLSETEFPFREYLKK